VKWLYDNATITETDGTEAAQADAPAENIEE
jgi:hypothetical protein